MRETSHTQQKHCSESYSASKVKCLNKLQMRE